MIAANKETLAQGLPSQADRFNAGKPKLSFLLSAPHAIQGVAKVMEFGAAKYSRDNWLKGLPYSEIVDSLLRHASSFNSGENLDEDSGLPHVDHMLCNALFLAELFRTKQEFDDRIVYKTRAIGPSQGIMSKPYGVLGDCKAELTSKIDSVRTIVSDLDTNLPSHFRREAEQV